MAGERDVEAVELVKAARRRRVGFGPTPATKVTLPRDWKQVLADALAEGTRDLVSKLSARPSNADSGHY